MKKIIMQSYLKYTEYYDRKAKAPALNGKEFCFMLQPRKQTAKTLKNQSESSDGLAQLSFKSVIK